MQRRILLWAAIAALVVAAAGAVVYRFIGEPPPSLDGPFVTRVVKQPPDGFAPLRIRGDRTANYYVRVRDVASGKDVLIATILGGGQIEARMPAGSFELRFAAGANWQSERSLFGPETLYFHHDQTMTFLFDGTTFLGYSVDLVTTPTRQAMFSPMAAKDF